MRRVIPQNITSGYYNFTGNRLSPPAQIGIPLKRPWLGTCWDLTPVHQSLFYSVQEFHKTTSRVHAAVIADCSETLLIGSRFDSIWLMRYLDSGMHWKQVSKSPVSQKASPSQNFDKTCRITARNVSVTYEIQNLSEFRHWSLAESEKFYLAVIVVCSRVKLGETSFSVLETTWTDVQRYWYY